MSSALEAVGLRFSYGDGPVLESVSFSVAEGEFAAIVGDNGVGKSTLMGLVLGDLVPDAGEVRLFGDPRATDDHHADIAYVSQDAVRGYRNFPTTIEELVSVHLAHLKARADVGSLLETVGLAQHRRHALRQLSGGQLQRVGLLAALVKGARLVLLDEPTTGIDRKFSAELYRILRNLCDEGRTVVMITHHLLEAAPFIDRTLLLSDGRLSELDPSEWGAAR